ERCNADENPGMSAPVEVRMMGEAPIEARMTSEPPGRDAGEVTARMATVATSARVSGVRQGKRREDHESDAGQKLFHPADRTPGRATAFIVGYVHVAERGPSSTTRSE